MNSEIRIKGNTCPHCNKEIVRYPIRDEDGKLIPKNLFRMDVMHLLFLISILLILFGFSAMMKDCNYIIEQPCNYCKNITPYCERYGDLRGDYNERGISGSVPQLYSYETEGEMQRSP